MSDKIIRKVFHKIRETLYYYYLIVYNVEEFAVENKREYFSCEESKFTTLNNEIIWVLDMRNTETKDFLLVVTKIKDTEKIKAFITRYIPSGNFIVTDGWGSYSWLNHFGYIRLEHNHGAGDFYFANESTSHAENLWNVLKTDVISTYFAIQNKDFLLFLREAEYKYKNRKLCSDDLIKDFFLAFNLISSIGIEN